MQQLLQITSRAVLLKPAEQRHTASLHCTRVVYTAEYKGPMSNNVQIAASLDFQQFLE